MSAAAKKQAEGNIQTFLRIRPSKKASGFFVEDELNEGTLKVTLPEHVKNDFVNNSKLHHAYHFNGIVHMTATQEDVFKKVGVPAVQNALDGFNSTIFAYGQTGSGKTFTITGGIERYVDRGIIPRSISMIFNEFRTKSGVEFKAYISYLELYNEQGYDLLDESHETKALEDLPKVTMLEDEHGNFHLKNLTLHAALTEEEALDLLFMEMVIVALYEKATKGRAHVPYRNSMMTSVLRDSLGGNCKTIMIATINPEASHSEESLSTCRFAQRVSLIKNRATINEGMDPELVIKRLKNEVLTLREEIAFLKGESGEGDVLNPQEAEDLKERCRAYVDNPDPLCLLNLGAGGMTLTKIKDAFAIFKNLTLESRHALAKGGGLLTDGSAGGNSSVRSDQELLDQVKDLKSCLLQRDNEIAILVNMVKKGKKTADAGGKGGGQERQRQQQQWEEEEEQEQAQMKKAAEQPRHNRDRGPQIMSTEERESLRAEKIIKKHLFGVQPPEDKKIFDDMAACFEYFRANCEQRDSIEENKALLKEKMKNAQALGERANQSRNTITYLKNSIEAIRREKALTSLSDAKSSGEDSEQPAEISPEEATHRRAIEQEKAVYRESFDKLRVLKPEIEHIRKILEKSRGTLQNQFDQWYSNLHARDGKLSHQSRSAYSSQQRPQQQQSQQPQRQQLSHSSSSDSKRYDEYQDRGRGQADAKESLSPRGVVSADAKQGRGGQEDRQKRVAAGGAPSQSQRAPPSSLLNDSDDDDDDDVNEDIEAFYKAKEELLKRRSNNIS